MANVFKISDATALAMHSMLHLALDPAAQSTAAEIAEAFDASKHHLAKVHQRLVGAGLIQSKRGPAGGIMLARDPSEITLLDIYEVMEGPLKSHPCLFDHEVCPREHCALSGLLPQITECIRDYFEKTTLAMLAEKSGWKGTSNE